MSGIIERLESKMDFLISLLQASGVDVSNVPAIADVATSANVPAAPAAAPTNDAAASDDPYAGVDADGVPWDKEIHSKAKEPINQTTGKWKRKKGITDKLYEERTAELKAKAGANPAPEAGSVPAAPTAANVPVAPTAAAAPTAPTAPVAPAAPAAPAADTGVKGEVLKAISDLESIYNVDSPDIERMIVETCGVDTLDKATEEALAELKLKLNTWASWLLTCSNAVNRMTEIATKHGHIDNLNQGLVGLYAGHDQTADCLELVPASSLPALCDQLDDYLKSWEALG